MNAPLQAFVLKCPECGAPQPGTTATCTHCKVPLMWAPSRSFGKDDHALFDVEDEPGTELMSFGPLVIGSGQNRIFHLQPQKHVRPTFLWIHPRCADNFHVSDLRCGRYILGTVSTNPLISGVLFSRGRGFPLESETLQCGEIFSFRVDNATACVQNIEGVLRVMSLKENKIHREAMSQLQAYAPVLLNRHLHGRTK